MTARTGRPRPPVRGLLTGSVGEAGTSPVTAVFGVGIFLGFLLLAVQVLLHLYGTSTVGAAAFDGARRLAAEEGLSCAETQAHVRMLLGSYGHGVSIRCETLGDQIGVRVTGPSPAPLVQGLLAGFDLGGIDRTAYVRVEAFRSG